MVSFSHKFWFDSRIIKITTIGTLIITWYKEAHRWGSGLFDEVSFNTDWSRCTNLILEQLHLAKHFPLKAFVSLGSIVFWITLKPKGTLTVHIMPTQQEGFLWLEQRLQIGKTYCSFGASHCPSLWYNACGMLCGKVKHWCSNRRIIPRLQCTLAVQILTLLLLLFLLL